MENSTGLTLREFIETSLVEIFEAIEGAQKRTAKKDQRSPIGASYSRSIHEYDEDRELISQETGHVDEPLQKIEFDIAVTVERKKSAEGSVEGSAGGKILVASAETKLSGTAAREMTNSRVSRIKFAVPVVISGGMCFGLSVDKTKFRGRATGK